MFTQRVTIPEGKNILDETAVGCRLSFDNQSQRAMLELAVPSLEEAGQLSPVATTLVIYMSQNAVMEMLAGLDRVKELTGWPLASTIEKRDEFPGFVRP